MFDCLGYCILSLDPGAVSGQKQEWKTPNWRLLILSNHGLSCTVSQIKGDFGQKLQIFPVKFLMPLLREFASEFYNGVSNADSQFSVCIANIFLIA